MIILFDLDGVIIDTETHYTYFWEKTGRNYLGVDGFANAVKGQAIFQIFSHFDALEDAKREIEAELDEYDAGLPYDYIPGADVFLRSLKEKGVPFAIVTSSNDKKMKCVRRVRPELWELADFILTCDHFSKSKPDPECFLKGMEMFGATPEETVIFEDSIHGLHAARAAGARVIGVATSNPRELIEPLSDAVIDNFIGFEL